MTKQTERERESVKHFPKIFYQDLFYPSFFVCPKLENYWIILNLHFHFTARPYLYNLINFGLYVNIDINAIIMFFHISLSLSFSSSLRERKMEEAFSPKTQTNTRINSFRKVKTPRQNVRKILTHNMLVMVMSLILTKKNKRISYIFILHT